MKIKDYKPLTKQNIRDLIAEKLTLGLQGDKFQVCIKINDASDKRIYFWVSKASQLKKVCRQIAKEDPSMRIDSIEYWGRDRYYPDIIDYNYCSESARSSMLSLWKWYEEFNYCLSENGEYLG